MMKLIILACALIGTVICESPPCKEGMWGEKCEDVCGYCLDEKGNATSCDNTVGTCPLLRNGKQSCVEGWIGFKCNEPTCDSDCHGFKCIAPNTCFCEDDVNKVAPTCEDLRVRGMYGSITALLTITFSIILCGIGSNHWEKKRQKRKAMMGQHLQLEEDEQ